MVSQPLVLTGPDKPAAYAQRIMVLVAEASAARAAVDAAIRLAAPGSAQIVLIGLPPSVVSTPVTDLDEAYELLLAVDLGISGLVARHLAVDDETRIAFVLRYVLLPLQSELIAQGIPAAVRVLCDEPEQRLRRLLQEEPASHTLVVSAPRTVHGDLRDLTAQILRQPPCAVYVAGPQPDKGIRARIRDCAVRNVWLRRVRQAAG